MQKLKALVLFILAAMSFAILASGSSHLERNLPGGLPLGNALASIGLCSLAGSAFYLSPAGSVRRRISQAALAVTLLWLPVSIALAGNLMLNFSGVRGAAWFVMSAVTVIAALGSLVTAIAGALLRRTDAA